MVKAKTKPRRIIPVTKIPVTIPITKQKPTISSKLGILQYITFNYSDQLKFDQVRLHDQPITEDELNTTIQLGVGIKVFLRLASFASQSHMVYFQSDNQGNHDEKMTLCHLDLPINNGDRIRNILTRLHHLLHSTMIGVDVDIVKPPSSILSNNNVSEGIVRVRSAPIYGQIQRSFPDPDDMGQRLQMICLYESQQLQVKTLLPHLKSFRGIEPAKLRYTSTQIYYAIQHGTSYLNE